MANALNTSASSNLIAMRAGRHAIFYNSDQSDSMPYIKIYEEACDQENPTTNTATGPCHQRSYEWVNLKTSPRDRSGTSNLTWISAASGRGIPIRSGSVQITSLTTERTYRMAENQDFWNYSPTYNGTAPGVGCGAALPPVCLPGMAIG